MCATCGCAADQVRLRVPGDSPLHEHPHDHEHPHNHDDPHEHPHPEVQTGPRTITLEEQVLGKNDLQAERNRAWLAGRGVVAINLMSSPGSGKTTLLERTCREVGAELGLSVIEGDQETLLDADRIKAAGRPVVQLNTGSGCHLDAQMIRRGLDVLDPAAGSVVVVENVGNLVCPALFDLGELSRVVITSVTEGADKPLKYPHMFRAAQLVLINKSDLLPYVDFDVEEFSAAVRLLNPSVRLLTVSARSGSGLDGWYRWLGETSRQLVRNLS